MKKAVFLDLSTIGPDDLSLARLDDLPLSWKYFESTSAGKSHTRISDAEIIISNKCVLNEERGKRKGERGKDFFCGRRALAANSFDFNGTS